MPYRSRRRWIAIAAAVLLLGFVVGCDDDLFWGDGAKDQEVRSHQRNNDTNISIATIEPQVTPDPRNPNWMEDNIP